MRCAIDARYSSDLQLESSIEDQKRKCRAFADAKGWAVDDGYVRFAHEISGATLAGRLALESLLADAKRRPRPFDRILIDDTSRLARNVGDALKMVETLKFHGVGVTFVSQGIDTLDRMARQLVTLNGMMDEQFLVGLADKVHRGQEGRVLKGLNSGGKLYGFLIIVLLEINDALIAKSGHAHACLGIQRDHLVADRDIDNPLFLTIGPVGQSVSGKLPRRGVATRAFILTVHPQHFTGCGVESNNRSSRACGRIKDAANHQRRPFKLKFRRGRDYRS